MVSTGELTEDNDMKLRDAVLDFFFSSHASLIVQVSCVSNCFILG